MRQLKRLFYIVLLNIIISAITVGVVLQLWERDHPSVTGENTSVVITVIATQPSDQTTGAKLGDALTAIPTDSGVIPSTTNQPAPTFALLTYEVKTGDTLGGLAVEFNLTIEDILAVNNFSDPNNLYVGQIIYIPTTHLPTTTPTSVPPTIAISPTARPSATSTHGPTPTATPTHVIQAPQVLIEAVVGAGVLENEHIVLQRTGDGELSLAGWRIEDGTGNEYIFPQLTLYQDGTINLNTRLGQDTVTELFWGLTSPVWTSGKTVSLYDTKKTLRASFTVP